MKLLIIIITVFLLALTPFRVDTYSGKKLVLRGKCVYSTYSDAKEAADASSAVQPQYWFVVVDCGAK